MATERLYHEVYRPQFHFTPRQGWMNDPNGLVFYKGEYHLFFQHNPYGREWGNMTWGHAISTDLVHWQQLDHALLPDRLGTIFSGSAVVDWYNTAGFQSGAENTLVAIYTAAGDTSPESAGRPFTQCIAYSNDRGRTWTKYAHNPVLPHIVGRNRDPKVIWHQPTHRWIMTLYKDGNNFAFFSSSDLKSWTHLHDMTVPGCSECPDFFELPIEGSDRETKWVWTAANGHYLIGSFDGQRFVPESGPHIADWGANFYAVQTYSDIPLTDNRRIQLAWMRGGSYPGMPFNQQMSFPCELKLRPTAEGLRLFRRPIKEVEILHRHSATWTDVAITSGNKLLNDVDGELFHISADLDVAGVTEVGFRVRGEAVSYTVSNQTLTCLGCSARLPTVNGRITLQILADRTSLEVFGNEGQVSMTSCFLPPPQARALEIYAVGGTARAIALQVHELRSIWEQMP